MESDVAGIRAAGKNLSAQDDHRKRQGVPVGAPDAGEPGGGDLVREFAPAIPAPGMNGCIVIRPEPRIGRNVDDQRPARPQDPREFAQSGRVIVEVVEHVRRNDRLKLAIVPGQRLQRSLAHVRHAPFASQLTS
ncbi:MAG: hypothetical protein A3G75_05105 [Verrucomicrobia bacterium RIFCSPLOWO2_12_FULL_64_8]|nr:MAG: hypothetical protein A3G75_05105 [Verrucomicrobia bacterium RIFCSPLOWO2_12_FULL_64_8]